MEHQPGKIRYTIQYHSSVPGHGHSTHPIHTVSRNEPPLELHLIKKENVTSSVIEIVTAIDIITGAGIGTSFNNLDNHNVTNIRGTRMIIHSDGLSRAIRDVVKFYPGQNLTGNTLIIQEPYACLFHHMADLERFMDSERDRDDSGHVQILLDFLRPRYRQQYIPAKERSSRTQPTVMFEDLWIIMRPGILAYTDWNGHKIGCMLGKSVYLPPNPPRDILGGWSIEFWFLQVHWPSDQIGCTTHTVVIDRFDGEMPLTSLPIHPVEFVDTKDQARTRQRFIDRGRKVYDILRGNPTCIEYNGDCMDNSKQSYKGRIAVGGVDGIEELYPKHDWQFNWVSPSQLMQKNPSVLLSEIEFMVNPKTDPPNILTVDNLFILSPCLSALRLLGNEWSLITVENICPITDVEEESSLIVDEPTLELIQAMVDNTYQRYAPSLSRKAFNGTIIYIHGPSGDERSLVAFVSQRSRRPLLIVDPVELGLGLKSLRKDLLEWISIGKRLGAVILIDNCDVVMRAPDPSATAFLQALRLFEGVIFLTTSRTRWIDVTFYTVISLKVSIPEMDDERRKSIWLALERKIRAEKGIRLHQNATEFLNSSEVQVVNWHAHEITRCFKIAVALAAKHAKHSQESVIIVEDGHLKEAMNIVHRGSATEHVPLRPPADTGTSRGLTPPPAKNPGFRRSMDVDDDVKDAQPELNQSRHGLESREKERQISDSGLCIPELNRIEWDVFRSAGERELFRKTRYYAIDVLKGEPLITLDIDNQRRPKRQNLARKKLTSNTTILDPASQDRHKPKACESGQKILPERIRINSPVIIKVLTELRRGDISQPFLLFKPFRLLDFKDILIIIIKKVYLY
ncbi:hypothetical protein F4860DRAFT_498403 [Xylaria cubensis]|nr:hypothetical protein F4860DRAFT_498403 [Xylaria cubensis]